MRRGRLEIINDMLKVSKNMTKKTEIMYKANLSFEQLQKYLSFLEERNLINIKNDGGNIRYKTSEKGREFQKEYSNIVKLLNSSNT